MYLSISTLEESPIVLLDALIKYDGGIEDILDAHALTKTYGVGSNIISIKNVHPQSITVNYYCLSSKSLQEESREIILPKNFDEIKAIIVGIDDPTIISFWYKTSCNQVLVRDSQFYEQFENIYRYSQPGIPNKIFKYIKQFNYKYTIEIGNICSGNIISDHISMKETLFDGSYKNNFRSFNCYNFKSAPSKLQIKYHINTVEFMISILFTEIFVDVLNKFYGAHPETKTDFIIRIDAENKKYELALYRQGLKEPVVITESAYQLIVFKNKFEDYRSENYNQPRGAWIW